MRGPRQMIGADAELQGITMPQVLRRLKSEPKVWPVNLQELIALWAGAFGCSGDALVSDGVNDADLTPELWRRGQVNLRNLPWEGLFDGNGGIRACRYG